MADARSESGPKLEELTVEELTVEELTLGLLAQYFRGARGS